MSSIGFSGSSRCVTFANWQVNVIYDMIIDHYGN